ncbi:hypothetical protein F5Y12DRAFT_787701 [Xylaria sp. FL1777]|nr:hypothetical protein F5Y12DRAFT_787701 [Xylaria sp. FL1777]
MTQRRSLDIQLNAALLDFAPRYMKDQLEHLAHECDQRLERELLPRLQSILRQVDQERDAFEQHKQDAARDLRGRLNLLGFDAAAVDHAIGQLHAVAPRYLALFPSVSSLRLPVAVSSSASALLSAPSTAASSNGVFEDPPHADVGSHAASPPSTPDTSNRGVQNSITQIIPWASLAQPPSPDHQIQSSVIAESCIISCGSKRAQADCWAENNVQYKRQRTTDEKISSELVQPKIKGRIAFPNLMTGECIFHHANRKGLFVVRCVYCEPGIFTEPPLNNNRALKHFQEHEKDTPGKEELTNESIFERFALQVDGDEMASKYWIREHLGMEPHTFTPTASHQNTPQTDHTKNGIGRHEEAGDDLTLLPKLRESVRSRHSNNEREHEKPRRSLRSVTRPDYAEMAAPWTVSEVGLEVSGD